MEYKEQTFKLKCRELKDQKELRGAYRLRHEVYVQEMRYIDSENKLYIIGNEVKDELDNYSHHFGVYFGHELIGAARYNINSSSTIEAIEHFPEYGMNFLSEKICKKNNDIKVIEPSRIVVRKDFRYSYASVILFFNIIEHALTHYHIDAVVTKVRDGILKNFYRNYGFDIIEESRKKINIYGEEVDIDFFFGYLTFNKNMFLKAQEFVTKALLRADRDEYSKRIEKVVNKMAL